MLAKKSHQRNPFITNVIFGNFFYWQAVGILFLMLSFVACSIALLFILLLFLYMYFVTIMLAIVT